MPGAIRRALTGVTLATLLAAPLTACQADAGAPTDAGPIAVAAALPDPAPGDHKLTMSWEGRERGYEVHAPPSYRPGDKLPLVIAMHYYPADARKMREMTRFDAKADQEGFLVAYPNGVGGGLNALICCGTLDDVGFVKAIVEHLTTKWSADPDRVYATGISNGADMTYRLAVEAPGVFAAIAPVSGGFIGNKAVSDPSFTPRTPVSVISILGSTDSGINRLTSGIDSWREKVGCPAGPAAWADPQQTLSRSTSICANGSEVVNYVIKGMGHSWPGGTAVGLGDPKTTVNAVDLMWEFFEAHPRRG